jgi:hypothetical protein
MACGGCVVRPQAVCRARNRADVQAVVCKRGRDSALDAQRHAHTHTHTHTHFGTSTGRKKALSACEGEHRVAKTGSESAAPSEKGPSVAAPSPFNQHETMRAYRERRRVTPSQRTAPTSHSRDKTRVAGLAQAGATDTDRSQRVQSTNPIRQRVPVWRPNNTRAGSGVSARRQAYKSAAQEPPGTTIRVRSPVQACRLRT